MRCNKSFYSKHRNLKCSSEVMVSLLLLLLRWPTCSDRGWCSQPWCSASWCVSAASRTLTRPNRRARPATPPRRTGPSITRPSGITSTSSPGRGESGRPDHGFNYLRLSGKFSTACDQIFNQHLMCIQGRRLWSYVDRGTPTRVTSNYSWGNFFFSSLLKNHINWFNNAKASE